ncbi:MAG: DVU_1557 family redox protein [Coriobacteriales bacterium]|jgi:uncharacterized protein with PIN domain
MKCLRCNEELVESETVLEYLGHQMKYDFPRCPKCGQVFIPEDIVRGKMREVEMMLEDK